MSQAPMDSDDRLLTFDELAEYLSISKKTLYTWRTRKRGPEAIKVGRFVRFRKSAVDSWLNTQPADAS